MTEYPVIHHETAPQLEAGGCCLELDAKVINMLTL